MNKCRYDNVIIVCLLALASLSVQAAPGSAIPEMLKKYEAAGGHDFSAQGVQALWEKKVPAKDGKLRSCSTCHGADLTKSGKHARSGKHIDPMALSVNPGRFSKAKKIRKWFKRNCKWAWGRECTAQEKGDFLRFFASQ